MDDGTNKRPTHISANIDPSLRIEVINLLQEYKNCFVWDYNEIPGLRRELVELKLSLQHSKNPIKQIPRRFALEVMSKIKDEIERILISQFIRTSRYIEWLVNIVLVIKKNKTLRVCIDFRDLTAATPKDEYPMHVVDMLVDLAAGFDYLNMHDGYSNYNQIFIADEDVKKTVF